MGCVKFNGEDFGSWMTRCKHYFDVMGVPEECKTKILVINLEGEVIQWHQNFVRGRGVDYVPRWKEY